MIADKSALIAVAKARRDRDNRKVQLRIEANAWIDKRMMEEDAALDQAVIAALDDGHSVTAVAQAFTVSGRGPNRKAIYDIKAKYENPQELWTGDYPFEWVARNVETADGFRTVYDVRAELQDFGPEGVTGNFTWLYDRITHELDPVLTEYEPYPIAIKYYKQVLDRWLVTTPYPGVV